MCQIITVKLKNYQVKPFLKKYKQDIKADLNEKGGDSYSFSYITRDYMPVIKRGFNFKELFYKFLEEFRSRKMKDTYGILVLFSRQTPENESISVNLPPYYNKNTGKYYFVHGTISNYKELLKKYSNKINSITVDTEITSYINNTNELQGLYTLVGIDKNFNSVIRINKGLGLWRSLIHNDLVHSAVYKTTPTNRKYFKYGTYIDPVKPNVIQNLSIAYSGGLDITLSAYYTFINWVKSKSFDPTRNNSITLYYFKYNSKAQNNELSALTKFNQYLLNYIGKNNLKIKLFVKVVDFRNVFYIFRANSSLINSNRNGNGDSEFRANSAYVSFRNTLFAEFIANDIQQNRYLSDTSVMKRIVFGLNLSEGQIYGDNNQAWLVNMNRTLTLGGNQFDPSITIYSPFINKTKTNMIRFFVREIGYDQFRDLEKISFSCYYPDRNGQSCGICGSCQLRQNAIKRALDVRD